MPLDVLVAERLGDDRRVPTVVLVGDRVRAIRTGSWLSVPLPLRRRRPPLQKVKLKEKPNQNRTRQQTRANRNDYVNSNKQTHETTTVVRRDP